ncbi:MAG: hypothetical protein M1834_005654 [Cirrosporium novae-zelandiae]|nr:MAG: hypothetical protein M1834_005654 [Cirrosporium novae-zelandiae]
MAILLLAKAILPLVLLFVRTSLEVPITELTFSHQKQANRFGNITPVGAFISTDPSLDTSKPTGEILLNASHPLATFDYGEDVAGYPYFVVSSLGSGPVQIEVKYTEPFEGLNHPWGDGPWTYNSGLANTWRVETFNVTNTGYFDSYFIQGGQRWESVRLLTEGSIAFSEVGFKSIVSQIDVDSLPGHFECSNEDYNEIWRLGARSVNWACVEAGTQSSTFEITDDGALIRGQRAAISALGTNLSDYTLTFTTKIVRGGTGWTLGSYNAFGIQLLLVGELPEETTFVNTNKTMTPPNSILLAYGYSFVNQSTLPVSYLDTFDTPFFIKEDTWYNIRTTVSSPYISVWIDDVQAFNVSLDDYYCWATADDAAPISSKVYGAGSFGFGPWQDQIAYVKDVLVTSNENGTQFYQNSMTSMEVLGEYGVRSNTESVCLDGPKRDRLVWLGDSSMHNGRVIGATNGRWDFIRGTYEWQKDFQIRNGQFGYRPSLGYDPKYTEALSTGSYGLKDYQIFALIGYYDFYRLSGDIESTRSLWPATKKMIAWILSNVDDSTHLVTFSGFLGNANSSAISAALVKALNGVATIGDALNDTKVADEYRATAELVKEGINTHLWNSDLGVYSMDLQNPDDFSITSIAFSIISGVANSTRAESCLSQLSSLKLGPGFKMDSTVNASASSTHISPNTNGYLMMALSEINATEPIKYLLDNLFTAMINQTEYYTGGGWEYMNTNLTPGLSMFTSLAHPWGCVPTYIMPEIITGLRPNALDGGWSEWVFKPGYQGFGVDWATARVPTPMGLLSVGWKLTNGSLVVSVNAPNGTKGTLEMPKGTVIKKYTVIRRDKAIQRDGNDTLQLGSGVSELVIPLA